MSEEVKDENVSQSAKDIIKAIKEAESFGPFGKSKSSSAQSWAQWQCLNVDSVNLHYEIIAKEDTIYAEFHMEGANTELPQSLQTDVENLKNEKIKCFPRYSNPDRGLAIRWGDGVDVQNETSDTVKELSDQMKALHTAIDGVVSQHLIKYIFKDLIDNSDSSAEKFLIAFNKRICDFYTENVKNGIEAASYLLVKILGYTDEWKLPFGKKAAQDLLRISLKTNEPIPFQNLIEEIKKQKWLISPFFFWSVFFSHKNRERKTELSSLLKVLENHEDEAKRENMVASLINLREAKAKELSKGKGKKDEENLTIEGWTQLVDNLSKFAQICWELFKEVMTDNPNKDTINGYIQDIKTKKKNGENVNLGCDGVGKEAVPNILPFIRPDLKFKFDESGNVMSITKTADVVKKEIIELLENSKQIILTGAPGTGKTYHATKVAEEMIKNGGEYKKVQFHPGYDYSDFIIGLKPEVEGGQVTFKWENGVFKEFADKALKAYQQTEETAEGQAEKTKDKEINAKPYIFIIDEINRADLSRVFGEVFSLLEEDYRYPNKEKGITLPNKKDFILPRNLYIIGTMNDIDRSVESMDFALRRRFSWKEVTAEESERIIDAEDKDGNFKIANENNRAALQRAMTELNKYIGGEEKEAEKIKINEQPVSLNLGTEYQLGGAYFLNFAKYQEGKNPFKSLWNNHIAIILNEYLRGRSNRAQILSALKGKYDAAWKGKRNEKNESSADNADVETTSSSTASENKTAEENK